MRLPDPQSVAVAIECCYQNTGLALTIALSAMRPEDVGEAAGWSADRATAWRVSDGKVGERISLEEAARIAERVGLPVPGASS